MLVVVQPTRSYPLLFPYGMKQDSKGDSGSLSWILDTPSEIWVGNDCLHVKSTWSGTSIPINAMDTLKPVAHDTTYGCTVYKGPTGYTIGFANISLNKADGSYVICQPGLVVSGAVSQTINGWKASESRTTYSYRLGSDNVVYVKQYSQNSESSYYSSPEEAKGAVQDRIYWSREYDEIPAVTFETAWVDPIPPIAQHHYAIWKEAQRRFSELTEACDLGNLSYQVAKHCDFNRTNFLALAHDIFALKSEIKSWPKMIDALFTAHSKGEFARSLSNIFLSGKYGARLTWDDLQQQSNRILNECKIGFTPSRIYETVDAKILLLSDWYTGKSGISLKWRYSDINQAEKFIAQTIGDVRIQDLWDLVPYSFVMDWFLGIGNSLELFDLQRQFDKCDVSDIWYTTKLQGQHSVQTQTASGQITHSIFARFGLRNLVPLAAGSSTPVAHKHLAEGTALFIQRT